MDKKKPPTGKKSSADEGQASSEKQQKSPFLGRYEMGRLIGSGHFGKVYYAHKLNNGEEVAIKVMEKKMIVDKGLMDKIKQEITILSRLRHPNIVQLIEVMATKSKVCIVLEYIKGGELMEKVVNGRLPEDVARKYFQQLISAVAFCHQRGIFHRDIKPENLLISHNDDLKVCDFGLSALSDQSHQDGIFHTSCGTPAYVAPEVLTAKGYVAAKADIWSCGVVLFVLLAGYLPFYGENFIAVYRKICTGNFKCPRWFSPKVTGLIKKLLDTNTNTRITIPEIMEDSWFKKDFQQVKFSMEDKLRDDDDDDDEDEDDDNRDPSSAESKQSASPHRPMSLNAFDIISFTEDLNLSGLFEQSGKVMRFVSEASPSNIITKLEEIAKGMGFDVRKKNKGCRICMEGSREVEGIKNPLSIAVEIFELTPSLVVVEVRKEAGNKEEYEDFYMKTLKPGLESLMLEEGNPNSSNVPCDSE
ncbi:hypothetical protein SAY87_014952 [Trapa incisa]|uniref:non-specific serine/threonine protein kinase n=1 Tax=Trapa incisa TaxID=236973 RepID=A0AAN7GPF6_9MYRT|nr:hypothetical protein SAY87_014952 [Trapa incisa]